MESSLLNIYNRDKYYKKREVGPRQPGHWLYCECSQGCSLPADDCKDRKNMRNLDWLASIELPESTIYKLFIFIIIEMFKVGLMFPFT